MSELKHQLMLNKDMSWVPCYLKSEADNVIAEKDSEIARLKAIRKVHLEAIASMGAGLQQDGEEIRRLRRALWLARANRAVCEIDYWRKCYEHVDDYFDVRTGQDLEAKRCEKMIRNWIDVKGKCRAKAKEYL